MNRRHLLRNSIIACGALGLGGTAAWYNVFDGPISNPCVAGGLPKPLQQDPIMKRALGNLDLSQLWDCHFHLLANGLTESFNGQSSGAWLNPKMRSGISLRQRLQYAFYLNAACINDEQTADKTFVKRLSSTLQDVPDQAHLMLLAFDYQLDDQGKVNQENSTFYIPNEYAAAVASTHPQLEWIASIHPYREDAAERLQWCFEQGARAVKWLPPAQNIDPSSSRCDAFYAKLKELQMPLLTHAGEEKAVHSETLQKLANPLYLRRPLDLGVKVIVAHCASLGTSEDIESANKPQVENFALFARLMEEPAYKNNLFADISAINLLNRKITDIQTMLSNSHWHSRLIYGSDYPLPGVMPLISSRNLRAHGLLQNEEVEFLNQVKSHNAWLFDLLQKRLLSWQGQQFSDEVFATRRHFISAVK